MARKKTSKDIDPWVWDVGNRVYKLRMKEGLKQEQLGHLLGMFGAGAVSNWEVGKCFPSTKAVIGICQLFGVSADWLLFGKGVKPDGIDR